MRWVRFPRKVKAPHKRAFSERRFSSLNSFERTIIRAMIFCTLLLAVFQLKSVKDPVDFYLAVAGDIDYPAFKYDYYENNGAAKSNEKITLSFKVTPISEIKVKQNNIIIGTIGSNTSLEVEPGMVSLDATQIPYPVSVDIILNEKKYTIKLDGDIQSFNIEIKSSQST